jgi:hypothetical protein
MESRYNMSLVTMTLAASFSNPERCHGITLNLRHLGAGARYRPVSRFDLENIQSSLAITTPRFEVSTIWDANNDDIIFQHYRDFFIGGAWTVSTFPETITHYHSRQQVKLSFLGAPLVGAYEVSFDTMNPSAMQCLQNGSLKIGMSYTTPPLAI